MKPMGKLSERLRSRRILVSDGAWGTFLHLKGLGEGECPESWNLTHPDAVLEIARSYVEAGADIILTNSFGGSPFKLSSYGLESRVYGINRAAAEISRKAAGDRCLVLGSMGPTGKMVFMGEVPPEEISEGFAAQARGLMDGGADGWLVETMSDLDEVRLALDAAKASGELDLLCTFTFERNQDGAYRTMMGTTVGEAVATAMEAGVDAVGANCGNGTAGMVEIVREIRAIDTEVPVLVHANAGMPRYRDGKTVFPEGPAEMASQVKELLEAGATIIGGCCGTTPEHIRLMAQEVQNYLKE